MDLSSIDFEVRPGMTIPKVEITSSSIDNYSQNVPHVDKVSFTFSHEISLRDVNDSLVMLKEGRYAEVGYSGDGK